MIIVTHLVGLVFARAYQQGGKPGSDSGSGSEKGARSSVLAVKGPVTLGANRDHVLSRIGGTMPGETTWDAGPLGKLGAFIVPLLGALAAVSFQFASLYRSLVGPILRTFP